MDNQTIRVKVSYTAMHLLHKLASHYLNDSTAQLLLKDHMTRLKTCCMRLIDAKEPLKTTNDNFICKYTQKIVIYKGTSTYIFMIF